jgi:hypothetical protein
MDLGGRQKIAIIGGRTRTKEVDSHCQPAGLEVHIFQKEWEAVQVALVQPP